VLSIPEAAFDKLKRLEALLDRPVDAVVQDCSDVAEALQDLEGLVPPDRSIQLHAAGQLVFMRPVVEGARRRINLRGTQAPLVAEIQALCTRLRDKRAILESQINASNDVAGLDTLKQRLRALEEEARVVRESIAQKEDSLAASRRGVHDLSSELKADIATLKDLRRRLVGGDNQADEALIAGVDQIRLGALAAVRDLLP